MEGRLPWVLHFFSKGNLVSSDITHSLGHQMKHLLRPCPAPACLPLHVGGEFSAVEAGVNKTFGMPYPSKSQSLCPSGNFSDDRCGP